MNLQNPYDREALADQIRDDINEYCKSKYYTDHREHLGASILGKPCSRKLFYTFRWCKKEQIEGRIQRLFQVGHNAEPRFIEYLKGIGFEVWARDEAGEQFRIKGCNGHYGGSIDAIASHKADSTKRFICEFKTNGTGATFTDVDTKGIQKAKPEHWSQMCQYGYQMKIKYGLYLIENKNDSDIIVKIEELDWNLGFQLERKAQDIISSKIPPPKISEQPSYYECKYCTFQDICHHGEVVEENCRSCKFSSPIENAKWKCERFNAIIPKENIGKKWDCHVSINE